VFDAADVTWATSAITARYAAIYKVGTAANSSPLLGYVDFGATGVTSGGTFTLTWPGNGIFAITPDPLLGSLTASGPVTVTANNQVVKDLYITNATGNGINCDGYSGVVIRNCVIKYAGGYGIYLANSLNANISHINILHTGAPDTGIGSDSNRNGIFVYLSDNATISHILSTAPSTGIYCQGSAAPHLSYIKCVNPHGPFPRGQLAQFNACPNFILEDFYSYNDTDIAWTTDNINAYGSTDGIIRRGVIYGNNFPNGSCVQIEHGSSRCAVSDVDAYKWLNTAFAVSNGTDVSYTNCHTRDSYKPDPVRGAPSSTTGLVAICYDFESPPPTTERLIYSGIQYYNLASGNGIVWDATTLITNDFTSNNFTNRTPIVPVVPSL